MKLYYYPSCSTCKSALKYLKEEKIEVEAINISEAPPSLEELKKMLAYKDSSLKALFNTSGLQYRELNMKERLPQMKVEEALALLSHNGMLVKRPFLLSKSFGLLGFKKEEWDKAFRHK